MTTLSTKEIKKIAHLARLGIEDADIEPIKQDLDNILTLVDKMNSADMGDTAPLAHPFDTSQPLRQDQVSEVNQRDLLLSNAPDTVAGLFIVPQVIDSE